MSFQSALVDRARRVHRLVGYRDEALGESEFVTQYDEWYKCRLNPPDSSEDHGVNEAVSYKIRAEILIPKEMELDFNDRIEIDSKQLGRAIWLIEAQPQYLRRKRSIIGKTATVIKVTTA